MSGQIQDGDWQTPTQDGAKEILLALQDQGDFYAQTITRPMKSLASYYAPSINNLYNYTNKVVYSDDLSQSGSWSYTHATAVYGSTDPEGGATASKLSEDNATNAHNVSQALTIASGATSFGILAKAAERGFVRLRIHNATDGDIGIAVFNLSTGVVVSGTGTIKKLLNGWYWCFISATTTVSNASVFADLSPDGTTFSYLGVTGDGIYLWHATAITSIPTVAWPAIATTAATRAVTCPQVDPDDPIAFQVQPETASDTSDLINGIAFWDRMFARIARTNTTGGSTVVSKPSIPSSFSYASTTRDGANSVTPPSNGFRFAEAYMIDGAAQAYFDVYPYKTCTTALVVISGGTFTFTYKTSTTGSLNWNASNISIASAINLLASVIADGITVTVSGFGGNWDDVIFTASAGAWLAAPVLNAGSLTPAQGTFLDSTASSTVYHFLTRNQVNVTAHGLTELV